MQVARLHAEEVRRSDATPMRWLALTHGIYGAGMNWRGIARKVIERRPEWGVVLVDLRQHGKSAPGEPPHTIAACAADVAAWIDASPLPVEAIAGHSFGGKVMMAVRPLVEPRQTWILDSSPSARPQAIADRSKSAIAMLELMERMPASFARREDFVAAIVDAGHDVGLANWLAMNVVPVDGVYRSRLDLAAIRALLTDYFARDLWRALEEGTGDVEYVIATRSSTVSPDDRARLAAGPPHVHVHAIDAGHWLHIDAPAAVIELFATHLH